MTWIKIRDRQETRGAQGGLRPADAGDGMGTVSGTHQKGAEEDEGDKVEVGEVAPTLSGIGERVAGPAAEAGQHDLVPGLPSGAPEKRAEHEAQEGRPGTGPGREPGNSGELGSFPQGSRIRVRSGYQMLLLKKKPLALAFQADRNWESTSYGKNPPHQKSAPWRAPCCGLRSRPRQPPPSLPGFRTQGLHPSLCSGQTRGRHPCLLSHRVLIISSSAFKPARHVLPPPPWAAATAS